MREMIAAELRVGGPVVVKWPATNPTITRTSLAGEYIAVWVETETSDKSDTARFMVLDETDQVVPSGKFVGSVTTPFFGLCRVYRLSEH